MKKQLMTGFVFLLMILGMTNTTFAAEIRKGIENFPEEYKPYLQVLKAKHPNWEFSALYTEFDFNQVVSNEYRNDRNLVPVNYSDSWKCTDPRYL